MQQLTRPEIPNNECSSICKQCSSVCCSHDPCYLWPGDIASNTSELTENLIALLSTGNYTIDWWEGDTDRTLNELDRVMYPRPAVQGKEGRLSDPSWGGACTFYTEGKGCALTWEERPTGGRALNPSMKNNFRTCGDDKSPYAGKFNAASAWRPYQQHITDALLRGTSKESGCW